MNKSSRQLKSTTINGKRVFTLKSEKAASERLELCSGCAKSRHFERFSRCPIIEKMDSAESMISVGIDVAHCSIHEPIIGFQPPLIGFQDEFNTIRPGKSWSSRLQTGVVVGLLDVKLKALFGKASVTDVINGNIKEMVAAHAEQNHLMIADPDNAGERLYKVLSKIYGPRIINEDSVVSVISLRRL